MPATVRPTIAVFKATIKLNVTEKNNVQVCPPEFRNATPVVGLKLRTPPNGSRLSDTSNVDMCLYDGYNSQTTWFDVTASDGLTIDRRDKGSYSVLLESDKSGAYASRVDYNASVTFAGKKIALSNNETVRLQGVNNSAGRTVSLPGISVRHAAHSSSMSVLRGVTCGRGERRSRRGGTLDHFDIVHGDRMAG
ncbi:hypothetical protein WT58_08505 [Burkholderia territorii]|uniref:CfaE/CblD family pilus tip adhesin n=1 Tax=Burkholderia territorii TaxID=1503055 RepID=UPI00075F0106|nr:hypothetical protein WT58_08505 [Burkholderia territorii]